MKTPNTLPWILWMAAASCSAQTLVIGLYDYSNLSAKETARFTEAAGQALAESGIQATWVACRGALAATPGTMCSRELRANEIVMKLDPAGPHSSNGGRTEHLGHTPVTADGGQFASVSVAAVKALAAEFGMPFELLLGYAAAHEAGHCLLGPGHSNSGLMRAAWNRKDAEAMTRMSLNLTKQESKKAVARLAAAEPVAAR
ncbi:MAG: hypothetical protein ABSC08_06760 [Bryobacteraceae bacterium]|jgi:hypothetical protein